MDLINEIEPLVYFDKSRKRVIKRGKFKCFCTNEFIARIDSVKNGHTKSCGCLLKKGGNKQHGYTRSITYISWLAMKQRCYYLKNKEYHNYGARGIQVCKKWKNSFESFLKDMGERPDKEFTLDRIDVNGNYCKENCRWITIKEQLNNKRNCHYIQHNNIKLTISQWAEKTGLSQGAIYMRLKRGWTIEDALSKKGNSYPTEKHKEAIEKVKVIFNIS